MRSTTNPRRWSRRLFLALATLWATPASAGEIAEARYVGPTDRYPHGVLGDRIEWSGLEVTLASGARLAYSIPDASVFEDIAPRLADIDGDGRQEAWTIRADALDGARLEAYAVRNGALQQVYAGPAIGTGFRWLNPIGVGDLDGDGSAEAVYVETPHIGGIVTVLQPAGDRLEITARLGGYSTHKIGSKSLDLATLIDVDGAPGLEIVAPTQVHDRIAVLSYRDGKLVERWRSARLPPVRGGLKAETTESGVAVTYRTDDGIPAKIDIPAVQLKPLR